MKGGDYDKDSSEDRYPGQFFFVSTQAAAAAGGVEGFEEPATVGKLGAARAEYFLTIVDVYTRMTWVYVLPKKSDVAETVKTDWLPMVERQQDRLVKAIRTDHVEKRWMRVHQKKYLEALAANFGKSEGHVATPLPSGFKCPANMMTKRLVEQQHWKCCKLAGMALN
ncbi:hypothetical protein CLOP_g3734 [Closterium sp. NIES-67]|nr:hypothetical protein CLOP_g3734 [Closterium sp. NIES-67]